MLTAALTACLLAAAPTPTPPPLREADLAPLFRKGPAAEGKAAYDAGRHADAAARLARAPEPEAAYIRALALLEVPRPEEALKVLAGLEEKVPDLADRVAFLRGAALSAAGRPREAMAAWAQVPDRSLLAAEARLSRARAASALGEGAAALEALAPLLRDGAPDDLSRPDLAASALLLAGRIRGAARPPDPAGARRDLMACWTAHPLAPESSECLSAAAALPAPHGGPPSAEETLRRAEGLLDANRNGQALALLEPAVAALRPDDLGAAACRARAALGRGYRKERSYRQAIDTLRPVVAGCEDEGLRVRSLYLLAGASSISGDRDEAVALYRQLARDFAGHAFADDALFFAADLLARAGKSQEAREALAALVRDHPGGDYREEARFRLAWLLKQAGDLDGAVAQLLAVEEEQAGRDGYEHARAAYWRARLLAGRGEDGRRAAEAVFTELATRYPTDYYGLLARARLDGHGGQSLPARRAAPAGGTPEAAYDPGPLREEPHFRAGLLLLRMGLPRAASEELSAIPAARLRAAGDAPEPVLLVADLLDRAGDHRAAHNLLRTRARGALRKPPEGENLRAWRIAYPPAYRDDVRRWAPPAGVPVELVQALMREESALDPRAMSGAGAVGLTQLMLPTAQSVAKSLKLSRPTRTDLMRASLNIRLGSHYLGELVRRFDGSLPLALAAYNAGGGAVRRWLGGRDALDVDEFVEEIPVEETRGYVKRVLRSYAAYRLLYGAPEEASLGLLRRAGGKG
ncbi:Lytic transglycosylase catalytic [Anaeromyxobacter dehalogenans 2CP-1]|uniref:Lytic transglycosylase catalytic n=1 Tax=Anaeromyxobacter dehalogenans (strain ATCC BAA-258 / DSM 21875 / 2CP-1) TaxID=455488 RepID=B8J8A0_ANAD2|nr:transglycosylase SLT domain-containing protein [Anaeromyxobacter dehalogenans]ACL65399.1 Lytic transglycosylase catalytic [Anaeromyxobacter dehalogenans 2CP-1]